MRAALKKSIALSLAALTVGVALAGSAGPASAWTPFPPKPFPFKPIPLPPPNPYHRHFHNGFGFGPWVALGVIGAAAVAANDSCIQYRPAYDAWGDYLGQRPVNVCD